MTSLCDRQKTILKNKSYEVSFFIEECVHVLLVPLIKAFIIFSINYQVDIKDAITRKMHLQLMEYIEEAVKYIEVKNIDKR